MGFSRRDDEGDNGSDLVHRSQPPPRKTPEPVDALGLFDAPAATAATLDSEQFGAQCAALEPRMAALSISNDALRNSLRPASPPGLRGWIDEHTGGALRRLERRGEDALYWLWARAPWQRLALSVGAGAVVGLLVVLVGVRFVRPHAGEELSISSQALAAAPAPAASSAAPIASAAAMLVAPAPKLPPAPPEPVAAEDKPSVQAVEIPEAAPEPAADADEDSPPAKHSKKHRHATHHKKPRSHHGKLDKDAQ